MSDVVYTAPRMRDLPVIIEMSKQLGDHYSADASDPRAREVMQLYVDGVDKSGVVARSGAEGDIAGFLLYDITRIFCGTFRHARGDLLVVNPDFRGMGIATELVRRTHELAASQGAELFLNKTSVPSMIRFYERQAEMNRRGVYFHTNLSASKG